MGAGVAGTVQVSRLGNFLNLGGAKTANSLQSAASAVCDIVITVALTVLLRGNNSNMESTNMMMHKISIYAINRGALTAIAAVLNLILFLASPDTFYFFFGLLLSSKLYMNSMLGV
ncbi:hypothetical protein D9757_010901 [Collybiopsis confluens]|uniref:DUF6534 domain-containing protein n=1 Tax=Collybiopsis confluens TaxID=2823264 RepID=A0A8H5GI61_9AGAR|nr:hypothetical protein D9757_010901 [Collybiopsis confluens]